MKSTSKITVMNAIFCFKVQWTTPAIKPEWVDCHDASFVDKKSAIMELISREKLIQKTPFIKFRIKKIKICK